MFLLPHQYVSFQLLPTTTKQLQIHTGDGFVTFSYQILMIIHTTKLTITITPTTIASIDVATTPLFSLITLCASVMNEELRRRMRDLSSSVMSSMSSSSASSSPAFLDTYRLKIS